MILLNSIFKKKFVPIVLFITLLIPLIMVSESVNTNAAATTSKVKWAGVRESAYGVNEAGISPFPSPAGWAKAMNSMTSRWQGSTPAAIWLVGEVDYGTSGATLQFSSPGGTYDPKIVFDPNQYKGVNHEACLNYFDTHGVKVWLQIEPGFASVTDQINAVLKKFSSHPCVLGLAIDVEWYKKASDYGDNDYVSDSMAKEWENLVKSYNKNFTLLLKHYDPVYLPPIYRGDIVFCCDDELNGSLEIFLSEHKEMADMFYPNPFIHQIGYPSDKTWWGQYDDAPKALGDALAAQAREGQDIGIMWVDFSLKVLPYIDNGYTATPTPAYTPTPTTGTAYADISGYVGTDFKRGTPYIDSGFDVEFTLGTVTKTTTDNYGYFEFKSIPVSDTPGTVKISKAGYLDRHFNIVCTDTRFGTQEQPVIMWPGDVVKDGAINMTDIMEIAKCFNTARGDGKYKEINDFNKDNAVNMTDIIIVAQHFNKTEANYPAPVITKLKSTR